MTIVEKALFFAAMAHDGQRRKGMDVPYLVHPVSVAMRLTRAGAGDIIVAAGLLHDTLEDTDLTYEQLGVEFGNEIADIVRQCSECDKSLSWEARKRHTIDKISTQSLTVRVVECADKLDNISSLIDEHARLGDEVWSRFKRGYNEQLWYFTSLRDAFRSHGDVTPYITLFEQFYVKVNEFTHLLK